MGGRARPAIPESVSYLTQSNDLFIQLHKFLILILTHTTGNKPARLQCRRRTIPTDDSPAPHPQCRLLSLSPELRMMIWELVLGGHRLHIIQRNPQRLGSIICPLSSTEAPTKPQRAGEPFCEICQGGGIPQPAKEADLARAGRGAGGNGDRLLALALTCKQMYS